MSCEKHKKIPPNYTGASLKDLAEEIGDLHYESLEELLNLVSQKLLRDSVKDRQRGRTKLANELTSAAANSGYASQAIGRAWKISKPYMQ